MRIEIIVLEGPEVREVEFLAAEERHDERQGEPERDLNRDVDRNANTTSPRELNRIGQYVNQLEREILNFPAKQ